MKTRVIVMSIGVVLLGATAFTLKSNQEKVQENVYQPDVEKNVLVQAATAELKTMGQHYSYTGAFAPYREVMLIPQVHGQVENVYFREGDFVKNGNVLVKIDDDLLQAQLIAAESSYANAKRSLERYEHASEGGGVSNLQLDNLRVNLANAESQRKQLHKQIELSRIVAPFSGTMTMRDVEPGSVVNNVAIARITDLSQLKLEIAVPEKEVAMFKEGETATIESDVYPGKMMTGKIEYVADRADNAHNYDVQIVIKNANTVTPLKAGMYGTASIANHNEKKTLLIPRSALLGSAKNPQVFVVNDNKASLQSIRTGMSDNESVEVLEGLKPGDQVVITGHINLSDGANVSIVK